MTDGAFARAGRHHSQETLMQSDLEEGFANQQTTLLTLLDERKRLQDGSRAADESDRQITVAENLISAYKALKWYER
jgi:hypothetical protein